MKYIISTLIIAVAIFVFIPSHTVFAKKTDAKKGIAVMELFTSQGCSSCPSADALLGKYVNENNPQIICLSFNVDYWNRLGWKDVFSDNRFSQRQRAYAASLHSDVYTPQLVVNGNYQFIGSDEKNINASIDKVSMQLSSAEIQAQQSLQPNNIISVDYSFSGNYANCNLLAALVQNKAVTKIGAGENGGASLTEYNVVRDFETINSPLQKGNLSLKIPKDISAKDCSVVLYLQQKNQGAIAAGVILHL
jgi:hypothetical protein